MNLKIKCILGESVAADGKSEKGWSTGEKQKERGRKSEGERERERERPI